MNTKSAFRFEKLEVWQLARQLNRSVYHATSGFPKSEQFGLTAQVRRASVSVSSNIAEGSGRNSDADFSHFLEIAYGSLMEVVSQCYLALDENYLDQPTLDSIATNAHTLAGKITALSKSLGRTARISTSAVESRQSIVKGRTSFRRISDTDSLMSELHLQELPDAEVAQA